MADPRHKRDTNARRMPSATKLAAPIASLATLATVGIGVMVANPDVAHDLGAQQSTSILGATAAAGEADATADATARDVQASRSGARDALAGAATLARKAGKAETAKAIKAAKTPMWATEDLNLWASGLQGAPKVGEIEAGTKVLATGRGSGERAEVVVKGKAHWVTAKYLSEEKPVPGVGGDCTNGSSVPAGVSANIKKVHQAVCARFPQISTYGTFRSDGEHGQGIAVDIMVSGSLGWEVAEFIRANYADLGVAYLIYSQKIWSVERGGEGWRGMSDRGSATANHYDHVHVTTY